MTHVCLETCSKSTLSVSWLIGCSERNSPFNFLPCPVCLCTLAIFWTDPNTAAAKNFILTLTDFCLIPALFTLWNELVMCILGLTDGVHPPIVLLSPLKGGVGW